MSSPFARETMMQIHEKIYLQYYSEDGEEELEVTWCSVRQMESDVEYTLSKPPQKPENKELE
jgi:hypothetical protein